MKKMLILAVALVATAFLSTTAQAATLNWGTGATYLVNSVGTKLTGTLVQLVVVVSGVETVVDTALTSSVAPGKGTVSGVWSASDTVVNYLVATYGSGTTVYMRAYDTATTTGNSINLYYNNTSGSYWTLTATTDAATAQTISLDTAGYGTSVMIVPEPTSMALLALGAVAMGLRRKFRK